jgi:carboxymethylenebutenolidase
MPDSTFTAPDGSRIEAYLARPPVGTGPWPGVVLVHDAFGLTTVTRAHADRLAAAGYLALAPDLYARGGMIRCVKATFSALASGQGQAFDDIDAARHTLVGRDDCTGRVGVIGFCMGGGFALVAAARRFDASSVNYGDLPKDLGAALAGACPIVGSYGATDRMLKGTAGRLEAALTERDIVHDVKEYPGVGHSFLDRFNVGPLAALMRVGGMGYDHASAEDAWGRILRFFDAHLVHGGDDRSPHSG